MTSIELLKEAHKLGIRRPASSANELITEVSQLSTKPIIARKKTVKVCERPKTTVIYYRSPEKQRRWTAEERLMLMQQVSIHNGLNVSRSCRDVAEMLHISAKQVRSQYEHIKSWPEFESYVPFTGTIKSGICMARKNLPIREDLTYATISIVPIKSLVTWLRGFGKSK